MHIKKSNQRTAQISQPTPPASGVFVAEHLKRKLCAYVNGRYIEARPVLIRYRAPRSLFVSI